MVTPEEKKYFDFLWKLAQSRGIDTLSWDFYEYDFGSDFPLEPEFFSHDSGTRKPGFRFPIKLSTFFSEFFNSKILPLVGDVFTEFDVDNDNGRLELVIDLEKRELSVYASVSWLETGEEEVEITKMSKSVYDALESLDSSTKSFKIEYNGGGDDGYLEDEIFSNEHEKFSVPKIVEDFCYGEMPLGFENNEGGQGSFLFDMEEKTIKQLHSDNFEDSNTQTVFELEF